MTTPDSKPEQEALRDEPRGRAAEAAATDRDVVMAAVRAALAPPKRRSALPDYDADLTVARGRLGSGPLSEDFARNLRSVNGRLVEGVQELASFLVDHDHRIGTCDPVLRAAVGHALEVAGLEVDYAFDRSRCDAYGFGITLATAAIAESGTIVIDDATTFDRLAALAPWVHIAVVPADRILRSIAEAVLRLGDAPNIVWVTGPSKTADVEGILIEGVHGPGEQIALMLPHLPGEGRAPDG